jgi:type I restriction enzyme S subunit
MAQKGIVSSAYIVCAPKENIDGCFIGHFFKYPPIINLFRRFSQGLVSDTLNLKFNYFAQIRVKMPSFDE